MIVHFDTERLATDHLVKSGFNPMKKRPVWISKDKVVKATVHPVQGEIVCIFFAEISTSQA